MNSNKNIGIGRDAIKITISKIITMIISLISVMMLSRFRNLDEYGTYTQLLLSVNLTITLMMLGLPNSINYFLARAETKDDKVKFLSIYYTLSTILSLIIGVSLYIASPFLVQYFKNPAINYYRYFLVIYPWTIIIPAGIENVLIIFNRTSVLIKFRILNSITLLSIILITKIFGWDFQTYMLLLTSVQVIYAIFTYLIVKGIVGNLKIWFEKEYFKQLLNFSIPIGIASLVGTINIELDKLMVGKLLGTQQLAIYANASREMPVTVLATSFTAVLLPLLARLYKKNRNQEAVEIWGRSITLSYIIICFISTGFIAFAPDVMKLLFSEKYLSGTSIFIVFNILLMMKFTYFGISLNAKGKTKFIFYSSIFTLVLNMILNYLLYLKLGLIGPAIASLLSQLFMNIIQLLYTSKIINIRFSKVFPWFKLGYITSINFILGLSFYCLKDYLSIDKKISSLNESLLLAFVWGIIYFLIFYKEIKNQWILINNIKLIYDND